jgi:hypothetical protein
LERKEVAAVMETGAKPVAPEVVKLKDGQESMVKMRQEEGKDEDGDGWRYERVVWLCGKVLMRDVVKLTIEKREAPTKFKLMVKAWTQVNAGIDTGILETHMFKGVAMWCWM